ncbi:hypothetical protein [Microbacterium pumilum]|uniref:Uncharacterized protein n=1 Tax=Microbacterium pumilum TaxID=344165 RepID=A0ABN2SD28_9MICO
MTDAQMQGRAATTWIFGGVLLIAVGLLSGASVLVSGSDELRDERTALVIDLVAAVLLLLACAAYAFGFRPAESIVARRPVGVTALLALGLLEVGFRLWWMTPSGYGAGPGAAFQGVFLTVVIWVVTAIAAVSISRARVLPRPWNAAPLAAVALGVVLFVMVGLLLPMLGIVADPPGPVGVLRLWPAVLPLALGVISIMLGVRRRTGAAGDVPAEAAQLAER